MAPSSGRRTRTRREAELEGTPEPEPAKPSSTRSSPKKRKINSERPPPTLHTFDSLAKLSPEQLQTLVIPRLSLPDHEVLVASEESNEKIAQRTKGAQISAFARIAGPTWTVYMREERLIIGRSPDVIRPSESNANPSNPTVSAEDQVHIDLGPNKIVSRQHALIEFGSSWEISVTGRNGAKVDGNRIERGQSAPLHAGSVIEIGGCQMMFLLPDDREFQIARSVLEQVGLIETENGTDTESRYVPERSRLPRPTDETINAGLANLNHRASVVPGSTPMRRPVTPPSTLPPYQPERPTPSSRGKGMALETMEAIDYSLESMKDFKPPHSYAMLIGLAILSAEDHQLSLAAIYQWIKDRFAYFRHAHPGWQNSIRHNLSLNKYFNKVPRRTDEPGKGMKWTINEEDKAEFIDKHIKQPHKNARQTSSDPNTPLADTAIRHANGLPLLGEAVAPSHPYGPTQHTDQMHARAPRGITPPSFTIPGIQKLAYTPDRGPRNGYAIPPSPNPSNSHAPPNPYYLNPGPSSPGASIRSHSGPFSQSQPIFHSDTATGPVHSHGLHSAPSPGQTMLTSSAAAFPDEHPFSIASLTTPAPRKQQPALPPPSTLRMPSSFMAPTSSPAPFWKFMSDTPNQFSAATSPQKFGTPLRRDLQSSSPPPPEDRRRDFGSPVKMGGGGGGGNTHEHGDAGGSGQAQGKGAAGVINGSQGPGLGIGVKQTPSAMLDDDMGVEGGIDLAKGWQTIGQYHEKLSRASGMATAK